MPETKRMKVVRRFANSTKFFSVWADSQTGNPGKSARLYYSNKDWTRTHRLLEDLNYYPTYFETLDNALAAIQYYRWTDVFVWRCHVRGIKRFTPRMLTSYEVGFILRNGFLPGTAQRLGGSWPKGTRMTEKIKLAGDIPLFYIPGDGVPRQIIGIETYKGVTTYKRKE